MWDFFVSYSSKDRELVKDYVSALSAKGWRLWIDLGSIASGDSLASSIEEGLAQSKHGLIFYSQNYVDSEWAQREKRALLYLAITSGGSRGIHIVKLDNTQISPLLSDLLYVQ